MTTFKDNKYLAINRTTFTLWFEYAIPIYTRLLIGAGFDWLLIGATYWENSCSFSLRYVSWYKCLVVGLVFSHLGFSSGNLFLIAPFPDLCLLVPFYFRVRYFSNNAARVTHCLSITLTDCHCPISFVNQQTL